MKFIVATLLTAVLAFVAGLWLDWWSIAIAAFVVGMLVHQKAGWAFFAGSLGGFLVWGVLALMRDAANESLLSKKVAAILPLGGSTVLLVLTTAVVAALVTGFGAMSGSYLRKSK